MSRQFTYAFYRAGLILLLGILAWSCASPSKPNVVFILVDDLGWSDLGCYGSNFYDTPNLDRLAEQSIRFTNAYAASPVCSPTRAAILTGKHPARVGITDWIPGMSAERANNPLLTTPEDLHNLPLEELTLAELFREQGYRTFFAGKWHLGESEAYWPLAQGFDVNMGGNHKGQPTFPGGKGYYAPYGNPCLSEGPPGEYLTDRLTDESIRFIESAGEDPYFLYLSFYTVHTPIQGCLEYDEIYLEKSLALPDSGKMLVTQEGDAITRINQSDPKYAAMLRSLDSNVGRLLQKLEDSGHAKNTIVVFTSDNGGLSTTPRGGPTSVLPLRAGKGWCYEGGVRVPLLIRLPALKTPGRSCDQPVISMDFFPTLTELAGLEKAAGPLRDGRSLVPFMNNPDLREDRKLVWHYPHYHGSSWRPGSALRSGSWKLVEFYEDGKLELYDLSTDMGEKINLRETFPELADSLRHEMFRLLDEMGSVYPERKQGTEQHNK
jgi:arylsulfatase A-like enzyme